MIRSGSGQEVLVSLLKIVGFLGGLAGVAFLFGMSAAWLSVRAERGSKLAKYILRGIATVGISALFGPIIYLVATEPNGWLLLTPIAGFSLVLLVAKYFKSLPRRNALIQMLYAIGSNLCPVLVPKKNPVSQ